MLGLGFGEIVILVIVGIVVVGPRRLPSLMRTAGQWIARLRNMSADLRAQSGIDDLIREEGLTGSLEELRSMSRVNVLDTFSVPVTPRAAPDVASSGAAAATTTTTAPLALTVAASNQVASRGAPPPEHVAASTATAVRAPDEPLREREYPLVGCDAYDALPDDVLPYMGAPSGAVPYAADAGYDREGGS